MQTSHKTSANVVQGVYLPTTFSRSLHGSYLKSTRLGDLDRFAGLATLTPTFLNLLDDRKTFDDFAYETASVSQQRRTIWCMETTYRTRRACHRAKM